MTAAWDCTSGSEEAFSPMTEWRMGKNRGFSVKDWGVGGRAVVVPRASDEVGGSVGRRERIRDDGLFGSSNAYCGRGGQKDPGLVRA